MAQTLPDCYRVTFTWLRSGNDEVVQTFHCWVGPTGASFADAEELALQLATWYKEAGNEWKAIMSSALTLDRIVVYDMSPGSLVNAEEAVGETGGAGSATTAQQIAAVITWTTAMRGASYRGRTYIGPFQSAWLTSDGLLNASALTNLADAAEALWAQFQALSHPMMVASFTHQHMQDITGCRIDDSPDVQRSRQVVATTSEVRAFGESE